MKIHATFNHFLVPLYAKYQLFFHSTFSVGLQITVNMLVIQVKPQSGV